MSDCKGGGRFGDLAASDPQLALIGAYGKPFAIVDGTNNLDKSLDTPS